MGVRKSKVAGEYSEREAFVEAVGYFAKSVKSRPLLTQLTAFVVVQPLQTAYGPHGAPTLPLQSLT